VLSNNVLWLKPKKFVSNDDSTCQSGMVSFWYDKPYKVPGISPNFLVQCNVDSYESGTQMIGLNKDGYEFCEKRPVSEHYLNNPVKITNVYTDHWGIWESYEKDILWAVKKKGRGLTVENWLKAGNTIAFGKERKFLNHRTGFNYNLIEPFLGHRHLYISTGYWKFAIVSKINKFDCKYIMPKKFVSTKKIKTISLSEKLLTTAEYWDYISY